MVPGSAWSAAQSVSTSSLLSPLPTADTRLQLRQTPVISQLSGLTISETPTTLSLHCYTRNKLASQAIATTMVGGGLH